jgi:histidinol-phosphate/aromatic aminotransferase/cobyric acid decarboxylase-like protein
VTIDFRSFIESKPAVLQANPDVVDLTELNVVSAYSHLRAQPSQESLPEKAHRCHLAEFWLDAMGISRALKRQALVSQGVRHSLSLLFVGYAKTGMQLCLPADVYPVYLDLAASAGAEVSTYLASECITIEKIGKADILLITNPAKPWGTLLSEEEVAVVKMWLEGDKRRRVIVDAVYTWEQQLNSQTMELFATGQAFVLHSLSKGWLYPLVLGIALVPEQDVEAWTPRFHAALSDQERLRFAHFLLTQHADFPTSLPSVFALAESRLRALLLEKCVRISDNASAPIRYHFVIQRPWSELLKHNGILALPACIFGYPFNELSIVTSLPQPARSITF